jgi:hypothetical protein
MSALSSEHTEGLSSQFVFSHRRVLALLGAFTILTLTLSHPIPSPVYSLV